YGGGRFAMDVNVIWVPHALEAVGTILDALKQLGVTPVIREQPLAAFARDRAALQRAVTSWKGAERHFRVALARTTVSDRVAARPLRRARPPPRRRGGVGVAAGPLALSDRRVGPRREPVGRGPRAAAPRR